MEEVMNNFEIYKLKKAGMSNKAIYDVLTYGEKLSLKQIIIHTKMKNHNIFLEKYRNLDIAKEKVLFSKYKSISIFDEAYPEQLRHIYNPPVLLFYKGDISLLSAPILSFVGSRKSSDLGTKTTYKLIKELKNNFVIASGLARGIDTTSHISALKNGGRTIAVIGCGLDSYYPKENKDLQDYIAKNHLLISEYLPGEQPLRYHFPERNRILAGLALGVVVIEAKKRSGSLITCERAMEEGRDIYSVPGNVLDGNFAGNNYLIKEGAKLVTEGLDILSEYNL